jgi:hypothetical protein
VFLEPSRRVYTGGALGVNPAPSDTRRGRPAFRWLDADHEPEPEPEQSSAGSGRKRDTLAA